MKGELYLLSNITLYKHVYITDVMRFLRILHEQKNFHLTLADTVPDFWIPAFW